MLNSLELIGFKSFADKTSFAFSPGITGVVGPNGSGKSNVVDGVKWILGNQSAKSLRGKEMTDVIFNGSTGRKGAGFAEATLHFDNSTGFLPIEQRQVSIGRRIWTSGDSEYLINNQVARLKDIKDLLSGSGIGASAYCIIEQGRVDQILQSNPANRRMVFEEAAGISRFKGRKAEALRKLERVEQNLQRLTDIVDELEARLNSTRNQAAKAAKYRELADELRELWLGLASDDFRRQSGKLELSESTLKEAQRQLDDVNERQTLLESQIQGFDFQIAEVEDRLRAIDRQVSDTRQKVTGHQTTIRHQLARQREMETELVRLRRQRTIMHNRLGEARAESERTHATLAAQLSELDALRIGLQQKQNAAEGMIASVKGARAELETLRNRLLERTRRQAAARSRLDTLQGQLEQIDETDRVGHSRREQLLARREHAEREIELQDDRVRTALDALQGAEHVAAELADELQRSHDAAHRLRERVSDLREERSAAHARKAVLEDLELRQEGVGIGVRDILERAQSADSSPWNRIRGSVIDLMDVDLEHAPLVEVALGQRAQLILIDDIPPLVDYLQSGRRTINGRVGFLAIDRLSDDDYTPDERFFDRPGVVNRADRLVRPHPDSADLVGRLLGRTWIVDTLQVALELSSAGDGTERFVTLQGELLEPDGSLFVGTMRCETAILSRRSELRRLKNDLIRYDRLIQAEEFELDRLQQSQADLQQSIDLARSDVLVRREQLAEAKSVASGSHGEYQSLQQQLDEVSRALEEAATRRSRLTSEEQTVLGELTSLEQELAALGTQAEELEQRQTDVEDRLHEHNQQLAANKLELAKQEERVLSLQQSYARLEQELTLREQQRQEAERRFEQAQESLRRTTLTILNTGAELAELHLVEERDVVRVDRLQVEKDEARLVRGRLLHQESDIRKQRREIGDRLHQAEMQTRDARFQLQTLEQRIEEEYGLVLRDVVDSGASAIRVYLDERTSRPQDEADESAAPSADSDTSYTPTELPDGFDFDEVHSELDNRVNRLRRKIKMMGSVDTESLANLDELEQRYTLLSTQLEDLSEARNGLEEIIRKINHESKRLFTESFTTIRGHFQELFRKLFGGGEGDIILEDPNDVLECGVEIVARPPGKELRSISLLSGGEKTMTAVALLMSIFKSRPSPFCILDEVDAALDEANIDRFIGVVKEFASTTQFVIITHRKPTMTVCDVLYGVTMEQSGVSKRMSVRFDDVTDSGEFRVRPDSTASDAA